MDDEDIWEPPYDPNLDWVNWKVEQFWQENTRTLRVRQAPNRVVESSTKGE